MGGKKKKAAGVPPVPPAAAGNVAATGNGVADPSAGRKLPQKPNPAKATVKDNNKPKGMRSQETIASGPLCIYMVASF